MSEADKDKRDDEEIADATLSGAGGDESVAGGDAIADTTPGGGEDSARDGPGDYSLAGDAAEAGVEAHPVAAPPPTARRKGRGVGFWAVVIVIAFLAGAAAWPVLGPLLPASIRPGGAGVDEDARARLTALESELAELKARPAPDNSAALQDMQTAITAQAAEIEALQADLAKLAAAPDPDPAPTVDLGPLQQRLDALDARVESLAAMPPPSSGGTGEGNSETVNALRAQVAKVAQELAGIGENQATIAAMTKANAELQQTVAALTSRLAALEENAGDVRAQRRQEAKVIALSQLAADLRQGGGYDDSLRAAQTLAAGDAELTAILDPLAGQAAAGAPTLARLRQRFEQVAPEIVRAGIADAGGDWLDKTANRLASLITIRRVGEVAGDSVEAVVARAESRLGNGDLAAAVDQLEALEGAPARAAEGWLAAARERLAAEAAADKLQARITALVGAG
jgi:uroporphyrinogen-III synthase